MLKKIGLGLFVLLLVAVGLVWARFVIPLQEAADKFGPETAARDYALQDNGKLNLPTPNPPFTRPLPIPTKIFIGVNCMFTPRKVLMRPCLALLWGLKMPIALPRARY